MKTAAKTDLRALETKLAEVACLLINIHNNSDTHPYLRLDVEQAQHQLQGLFATLETAIRFASHD